jgi:hypothetical protein
MEEWQEYKSHKLKNLYCCIRKVETIQWKNNNVKQGVLSRTHKAYIPTAQTSGPTNVGLLMSQWHNVNL